MSPITIGMICLAVLGVVLLVLSSCRKDDAT